MDLCSGEIWGTPTSLILRETASFNGPRSRPLVCSYILRCFNRISTALIAWIRRMTIAQVVRSTARIMRALNAMLELKKIALRLANRKRRILE
jgi:hypothetical protein